MLKPSKWNCGRPRSTYTLEMKKRVLRRIDENPETSTRRIAAAESLGKMIVWEILHKQLLRPITCKESNL